MPTSAMSHLDDFPPHITSSLNEAKNDTGRVAFCGPYVLSAITGFPISKVEAAVNAYRNLPQDLQFRVKGTYADEVEGALAVYGFEIQENFDKPLLSRNLVQLWQSWHITLTRWLRVQLFVPISRGLLRRGPRFDAAAPAVAQLATMLFCGLWHGVGLGFALWGLVQGVGLLWVSLASRRAGAWLPAPLRGWWRTSPVASAASTALTVSVFAFSNLLLFASLPATGLILRAMLGLR